MQGNATDFQMILAERADLRERIQTAALAYDGDRADDRAVFEAIIVPTARSVGIELTYDAARAEALDGRELTDDELEMVAGGAGALYRRLVSGALVATMVFSSIPTRAFAEEIAPGAAIDYVVDQGEAGGEEEQDPTPFDQNVVLGDSVVGLTADAGAFPADASLVVNVPEQAAQDAAKAAVDAVRERGRVAYASYVFDVSVQDAQGAELQPADGLLANLSFSVPEASEPDVESTVYQILPTEDGSALVANKLDGSFYDSQQSKVVAGADSLTQFVVDITMAESATEPVAEAASEQAAEAVAEEPTEQAVEVVQDQSAKESVAKDAATASTAEPVSGPLIYVDANGEQRSEDDWKPYNGETTISDGWYAVNKDVVLGTTRTVVGSDYMAKDVIEGGRLTISGNVNLVLCDGCKLEAKCGIYVPKGSQLTIWQQSAGTGKLIATAENDNAGIGGNRDSVGGSIIINGGDISATGDDDGAGIGGGGGKSGHGAITVYNGNVKAYGGVACGAGIGTGLDNPTASDITINGGTVYAEGGVQGAGIGGGKNNSGGPVYINGGDVTATNSRRQVTDYGHGCGAGIGCGWGAPKSNLVSITGGTVKAYGGHNAAGIGGSQDTPNGPVYITGGDVTAISRADECSHDFAWDKPQGAGAGIGSGNDTDQGDIIEITGGSVVAQSYGGAGIGGGRRHDGGKVCIGGSAHVLASSCQGAGIGGGGAAPSAWDGGDGGDIRIEGGTVIAASTGLGAGIGGGKGAAGGNISISGGDVTAIGGHLDYDYFSDHTVVYTAGAGKDFAIALTALAGQLIFSSEYGGAGIGGGGHGDGGNVTISGGKVMATAGMSSASAIGHGNESKNNGSLKVYREAKVSVGTSAKSLKPVKVGERVGKAQSNQCASIEQCDHADAHCTCISETAHSIECPYCEFSPGEHGVSHEFDQHGKCTRCGYQHVTVTLDPGEGTGSVDPLYATKDGSFTLPGTRFKAPEGKVFAGWQVTIDGKTDVYPTGSILKLSQDVKLVAQWAEPYQVWVGSTQVNSQNKDNVLRDGKVSYDPTTATLTIKGDAKLKDVYSGSLIYAQNLDLTITGEGTLSGQGNTRYVQAVNVRKGSVILNGDLTITGGNVGDMSYGILAQRDVVVAGGNIEVTGTNSAIRANRRLYVSNDVARLEVTAGKKLTDTNVLRGTEGIILGDEVVIKDPEGGRVLDYRLVDAQNNDLKHAVIANKSSTAQKRSGTHANPSRSNKDPKKQGDTPSFFDLWVL